MHKPRLKLIQVTSWAALCLAWPSLATSSAQAETSDDSQANIVSRQTQLMGTEIQISIFVHPKQEDKAKEAIAHALDAMQRIEKKMSRWYPTSDVSQVNRYAGRGKCVQVSPMTLTVLKEGLNISRSTDGAFSLSWAPLAQVWNFSSSNRSRFSPPSKADVAKLLTLVDDSKIKINPHLSQACLGKKGMEIGLGGIAKGYALDIAVQSLHLDGLPNSLVSAGGDIKASGAPADRAWTVGIQHPRKQGLLGTLKVYNEAVVTSGDYERYSLYKGQRFHHILNPRTGYPARLSTSVTVIAKRGVLADAVATALFVMGPKDGMKWLQTQDDISAMIIGSDGEVVMSPEFEKRFHFSKPIHSTKTLNKFR
jgi:FAD:protein FMN transferase